MFASPRMKFQLGKSCEPGFLDNHRGDVASPDLAVLTVQFSLWDRSPNI